LALQLNLVGTLRTITTVDRQPKTFNLSHKTSKVDQPSRLLGLSHKNCSSLQKWPPSIQIFQQNWPP